MRINAPLHDVSGKTPPLFAYVFRAVSTTAVMTGFFVDNEGMETGNGLVTLSITSAQDWTFATLATAAGGSVPTDAVGFQCDLSNDISAGRSGNPDGTNRNPAKTYPTVSAQKGLKIGRVNGA